MHPFFDSPRQTLLILSGWLLLAAGLSFLLSLATGSVPVYALALFFPLHGLFLLFILPNYYVCRGLPLGETGAGTILASHLLTLLVVTGMWYLLGQLHVRLLGNLNSAVDWRALFSAAWYINLVVVLIEFAIMTLLHYLYFALEKSRRLEQTALEQKLLLSQAELQTLRATVHPHFLFNSLNTLSNVALLAPEKAHRFCLLLADFLRYSIAYSRRQDASLASELEHIQNYLGIERERFGERLEADFDVDESVYNAVVPPMLLFPLVENAVKHGIDSCIEGGRVSINISTNNGSLVISVSNPVDPLGIKNRGTGHGLKSVEYRLKNRFGEQARMVRESAEGLFTVRLYLPYQPSAEQESPDQ